MKSLEELKKEQAELKEKLVELVNFVNSEEYFSLSPIEKNLVNQQRMGVEMELSALTSRVYNVSSAFDPSNYAWMSLLMSAFSSGSIGYSSTKPIEELTDTIKELSSTETSAAEEQK